MQGISACSLTRSTNGGVCRSASSNSTHCKSSAHFSNGVAVYDLADKIHMRRHWTIVLGARNEIISRRNMFRVDASSWLFGGNDNKASPYMEQSESANEDILVFFFKMDLQTRIQYALNTQQFDVAQELRKKLNEVEHVIIKQLEAKRGSSKSNAQDTAIEILRLRTELQKAIENENYDVAAKLRDQISKLEAESLAASAKVLAFENTEYAFRLGQKVRHKIFGYRAVICGMDPVCCESNSWKENALVDKLQKGANQPFYQVLVDVHADPDLLITYVAEENLSASKEPKKESFNHPYAGFLFYGTDFEGNFIPIKQLREKHSRPRYEAPPDQ